jgi:hypothetical protein
VTTLEFALGETSSGEEVSLQYAPFRSPDPLRSMADKLVLMSQFGPQAPRLRGVLGLLRGRPNHICSRYPGLTEPKVEGAKVLDADVYETVIFREMLSANRLDMSGAVPAISNTRATTQSAAWAAVLDQCLVTERLAYSPPGRSDFRTSERPVRTIDLFVPFSRECGYLTNECTTALAAFNGGFFNWLEEEFTADPYAAANDHVGLVVAHGVVERLPVFSRTALAVCRARARSARRALVGAGRVVIKHVGLEHCAIALPESALITGPKWRCDPRMGRNFGTTIPAVVNATVPNRAVLYNRLYAWQRTRRTTSHTPRSLDRIEFVLCGARIVAINEGGETLIPQSGVVLSLPADTLALAVAKNVCDNRNLDVRLSVDLGTDEQVEHAVQVGPQIIRHGSPVAVAVELDSMVEQYVPLCHGTGEEGIPPVYLSRDNVLHKRLARLGLGVRPDNMVYVVLIEGTEDRSAIPGRDSVGANLSELTEQFLKLGCSDAVALDGGGSAEMLWRGGSITEVSDRHDIAGLPSVRLLPGAWVLSN